jgi:hypothetical protein
MTKAAEIQDRIYDIEDLLNRMREANNDAPKGPQRVDQPLSVDNEPARVTPDGPAHRQLVDPARQYTDNMTLAGLVNPEAFGRHRDGTPVVVKSSEPPADFRQPPQATPGVADVHAPRPTQSGGTPAEVAGLPPWERLGVTGQIMAAAVDPIEGMRHAANNPTTTGAVNELKGKSAAGNVPPEQAYFDATVAKTAAPDVTNPSFEYAEGKSAYDEWLKQHTQGLDVQAGVGKPIADDRYGITLTQAVPSPKKA